MSQVYRSVRPNVDKQDVRVGAMNETIPSDEMRPKQSRAIGNLTRQVWHVIERS